MTFFGPSIKSEAPKLRKSRMHQRGSPNSAHPRHTRPRFIPLDEDQLRVCYLTRPRSLSSLARVSGDNLLPSVSFIAGSSSRIA